MKYIFFSIGAFLISTSSMAQLQVIISGGFSGPYQQMLPQFEKMTGITVKTLSGASQGTGPKTIKAQLESGATVDVVILSREGLAELVALGRIIPGSDVDLALAPLGAAVPLGASRPDISTVAAFKQALLNANSIVVPGSTSGIYLTKELFPKLGITKQISVKITERGSQATSLLAAREAAIAIQPSSELVNVTGIDFIGRLPEEIQLLQIFAIAITQGSTQVESAKKLIQFLTSPEASVPIQNSGMDLIKR
ncbi:extracellular solute-binding protein [Polynucleobacter sp. IMCC 30228]|uniref:substrate-binding domain-containing protein n=2 Tax=unclassified Polynucleobacter TaxID=2640945 RepID=UPI001F3209AF|nr:substrate-binding domain-containing protein [Polynucleobacter sp. IMCC 30228]